MMAGKTKSTLVRLDGITPQPWKNGAGTTRELLVSPSPLHWHCRISVANIDRDAPFSSYPQVQRWFTVIDGAGVALRFSSALPPAPSDTAELLLTCDDAPLSFDGSQTPTCRLLAGPTRDLNLMLRSINGGMQRAAPNTEWRSTGAQAGLFTARSGRLLLASGERIDMPAMSLLWFEQAAGLTLQFQPETETRLDTVVSSLASPAWWLYCGG